MGKIGKRQKVSDDKKVAVEDDKKLDVNVVKEKEMEKDESDEEALKETRENGDDKNNDGAVEAADDDEVDDGGDDDDDEISDEEDDPKLNVGEGTTPVMPSQSPLKSDGRYRNKQRCLTISSRGVTARYRHLLEDLRTLMPHHKKDSKLDAGDDSLGNAINTIAEMKSCNTVLYLECRKKQDCYMWLGKLGGSSGQLGPSVKFHVTNVHTMDELRLTGNCMRGSRPILSFDESFNRVGHCKLMKELFVDVFGTPRGHPKSKPFVDRVMAFYYADKRIWVRNYQILEDLPTNALEAHQLKKLSGQNKATSLVEIGPRFVLNPIRVFRGSFRGQTLFESPDFVSPTLVRAYEKRRMGQKASLREQWQQDRQERNENIIVPEDPLDDVFKE